jgi:hypothetical protein
MTSGQFWWLILIISIGCGFWATIGVLERLLKGLNAYRDLMHANARDQLAELQRIRSELADIHGLIWRHVEPDATEEALARLQDLAAGKRPGAS